jgi:reverse gyrase
MAAGRDGAGKVLMVAEKPSIARSIADILSRKTHHTHKSAVCGKCPVHEFGGEFRGRSVGIKVTSVLGHVMKVEFDKEYRNWDDTDPVCTPIQYVVPLVLSYHLSALLHTQTPYVCSAFQYLWHCQVVCT